MRHSVFFFTAVCLLLVVLFGCEQDHDPLSGSVDTGASVSKTAEGQGSIALTIEYEDGTAVANTPITINSIQMSYSESDSVDVSRELMTDDNGRVLIDKLPAANYRIRFEARECPLQYELTLTEHEQLDQTFIIPFTFDLIVSVHFLRTGITTDTWEYPYANTELALEPGGYTGITGANGRYRFENIPLDNYTLYVSRYGFEDIFQFSMSFEPPGAEGFQYHYKCYFVNEDPVTEIVNSDEELMHNAFGPPLILRAMTRDLSRGVVEYANAEWKSDIDGFLGHGTTYEVTGMTLGTHLITAFSGGNIYNFGGRLLMTDTDTAPLYIYGYSDQSYFQLPYESSYRYAVEPATLSIEDDTGDEEAWTFSDWVVTSEQPGVFTGSMTCDIEAGATIKQGVYTSTRWYGLDGNSILLTETEDRLTVTDSSTGTTDEVYIHAEYDPPLVILADYKDPTATPYRTETTFGNVAWRYRNGSLVLNRTEHTLHTVTFDTGPAQMIDTPSGMIEALPVTMTDGNETRTIYYARGIGIVGTESALFNSMLKTSLIEADIDAPGSSAKIAGQYRWRNESPVHMKIETGSMDPLERYRQIMHTLSW